MDKEYSRSTRALRRRAEQRRLRLAAPFFTALFALCLLAFIIPLRPTQSLHEKRSLTAFPDFSVETLLSGEYFDGISLWFSDTFPGREGWLSVASGINSLHGLNNNVVSTARVTAEEIPAAPVATAGAETAPPTVTAEAQPTPEASPAKKDGWGGLGAKGEEEALFGNCVQISGSAFELYGFTQFLADDRIRVFNDGAKALAGTELRLFDLPAPSGMSVMLAPEFVEELGCSQQSQAIEYLFAGESDQIHKVNVLEKLVEHNDEYVYYRTDHHWTALGAYYAYEKYCEAAGLSPVGLESYEGMDMGEFLGSFYYASSKPAKLEPDRLIAYAPPGSLSMVISNSEGGKREEAVVSDQSGNDPSLKYEAFIGGDNHLTVITNDSLPDAPNCLVIKDSYGNPFCVYLTQNYHKVYIVDYRKYGSPMSTFAQENDIRDIIVIESMSMTQGESANGLLENVLR